MPFGRQDFPGPLPPSVVSTPFPQIVFGLRVWVVIIFTFSLLGVPDILAWLLFVVTPLYLDGSNFAPVPLLSFRFPLAQSLLSVIFYFGRCLQVF